MSFAFLRNAFQTAIISMAVCFAAMAVAQPERHFAGK